MEPPAMVMGNPTKCVFMFWELNLARRKVPEITKSKVKTAPQRPIRSCSRPVYTRTAGTTPKDTKSQRESNSFPKPDTTSNLLASLPSKKSIHPAKTINTAAHSNWSFKVNISAEYPKIRFANVRALGMVFTIFLVSISMNSTSTSQAR